MTENPYDSILINLISSVIYDIKNLFSKPHTSSLQWLSLEERTEKEDVIGRKKEVKTVRSYLRKYNKVSIQAIGGMGKTTLAKYFITRYRKKYNHIVWVNASLGVKKGLVDDIALIEKLNLGEQISDYVKSNDPEQRTEGIFKLILNALDRFSGNNILIIDNADNIYNEKGATNDYQELLDIKLSKNWKILITTRQHADSFKELTLDTLKPKEALKLFYSYYKLERNDELVTAILKRVANHTLLIELFARTAQKGDIQLNDFLENLKQKGFEVGEGLTAKPKNYGRLIEENEINEAVKIAFNVGNIVHDAEAVSALKNLCLLPAATNMLVKDLKKWICEDEKQHNKFLNTLQNLHNWGWVQKTNTTQPTLYLHPVIQETLQTQLHPQPEEVNALVNSLMWLLKIDGATHGIEKVLFIPYAESVLVYFINEDFFTPENYTEAWERIAGLANNLSLIYLDKGELKDAFTYQQKAIEIAESVLDENHPYLASSYNNLSTIYKYKGELDDAFTYQLKAIEIREKVLGDNHPSLAISYNNLSLIYQDKGELNEALTYQLKAIEICEKVLGDNHFYLASSYNNLSTIYQYKGELDSALTYQLKAIEIREKVLGENHPSLATSYNNLSLIYKNKGELDEALTYQLKAIEIQEKVLGENHPDLATSYNNLSLIYIHKGELDEALAYQLKDIEILLKSLGENHPSLGISYNNLADIYEAMGQTEKAAEYYQKGEAIKEFNKQRGWP